jgi:hypothetical protein
MSYFSLQFTREGRPTGDRIWGDGVPRRANDVHFKFTKNSGAKLIYTKHGEKSSEHAAPDNSEDVGVEWTFDENGRLQIRDSHWTDAKGEVIGGTKGYIAPPDGADDWHLEVPSGKVEGAYWTRNGKEIVADTSDERIDVPKDCNDVHIQEFDANLAEARPKGASSATAALIGFLLGLLNSEGAGSRVEEALGLLMQTPMSARQGASLS